ncbi:hypothetical protein [Agrobacterium cavarae]|uniref:hypothetical protein n=1 Tax=Agrobacterium cavarae TaxID=2528239 RepID=UPI003FD2E882
MSKFKKTKLHPLFKDAIASGVQRHAQNLKGIKVLSGVIAEMMEELHGGDWKVQIDHATGLVAISQAFDAGVQA